jgi:hypothetical protein
LSNPSLHQLRLEFVLKAVIAGDFTDEKGLFELVEQRAEFRPFGGRRPIVLA